MRVRIAIAGLVAGGLMLGWAAEQQPSATASPPNPSSDSSTQPLLVDYQSDIATNRGDGIIRMIGNVIFHHNGAIIQCDSAFKYDEYRMDFFGKVLVWQDSTFIYGDRVEYDSRTAVANVYAPIIKMMRSDATLYTYNLTFNTKTELGIFWGGGVVTQKENLMESERGEYNAKDNIVKFMDSVSLRNNRYKIRTDSLRYHLDAEQATFLARTYIWDSDRDFLRADWGDYYAKDSTYVFTRAPYALTPEREMWADTMHYNTGRKQAYLFTNAQITDTINTSILFGDWAFYDDSLGRAVLTRQPSVRGWQAPAKDSVSSQADTTYMRADSILLDSYAPGTSKEGVERTMVHRDTTLRVDTVGYDLSRATRFKRIDTVGLVRVELREANTTREERILIRTIDSAYYRQVEEVLLRPIPPDSTARDSVGVVAPIARDSVAIGSIARDSVEVVAPIARDSVAIESIARDSIRYDTLTRPVVTSDSTAQAPINHTPPPPPAPAQFDTLRTGKLVWVYDTLLIREQRVPDTINQERIVRAFHSVRIWNQGYQAVCDSLVSYSVDSMSTMHIEPILWNENNQITADEMALYIKNEALDWGDFTGLPFIAQQALPGDTTHFNQASGKRLRTFFSNNEIDNALLTGNVLNLYYKDEGGRVETLASISCAELNILFEKRQPVRMIWGGAGKGTIYPIEDIPATQPLFLEGFDWQEDRRPKSASAVCTRIERPSMRAEADRYYRPTFAINAEMERRKEELKTAGLWSDRTDTPSVTPDYFLTNNTYL